MMEFQENVIRWLLEESNPPVRYLTLQYLLNDIKAAKKCKTNLMEYKVTQGILKHYKSYLYNDEKNYWKYKGKYWQLIFLGQFLASKQNSLIDEMARSVLSHRKWIWKIGGQCLTANLLSAFIRLGYSDHPVVLKEREILAQQIIDNKGIVCHAMDYSLLPHCYMAIPKLLLCFGEIQEKFRSKVVQQAIKILTSILLENEVYVYVPETRKGWMKELGKQPKKAELPEGQTVKNWILEQRKKYLNTYGPGKREEKRGWLKFGFPLHYNSDILEAMRALALLKIPMQPNLEKPLSIIKGKMRSDGTWLMENSLNGKMWIDVEEKKKPSKWITYFALRVLSHFL